jgi:hypothetical protein
MTQLASPPPPGTSKPTTVAWLETSDGARHLIGQSFTLGRSADNQVMLPGDKISRHHASIQSETNRGFSLTDLGSVNGTYLNNQRIAQTTRLYDMEATSIGIEATVFSPIGTARRVRTPTWPRRDSPRWSALHVDGAGCVRGGTVRGVATDPEAGNTRSALLPPRGQAAASLRSSLRRGVALAFHLEPQRGDNVS